MQGPNAGLFNMASVVEFAGYEKSWVLKPVFVEVPEPDEADLSDSEDRRVKFDDYSSQKSSMRDSVASEDLFLDGIDTILFEGELMKFKPGLSANFVSRYVQISVRAFRYFRSRYEAQTGRPIVAFRKRIIKSAVPYRVNTASYLKRGSRIA